MKRVIVAIGVICVGLAAMVGCKTPADHIKNIRLGMTSDEVRDEMGDPYTIRACKVYENGETAEVWEYVAPVFSVAAFTDKYDKNYWVFFENGKVVQWGEPGDFSGSSEGKDTQAVQDYYSKKMVR